MKIIYSIILLVCYSLVSNAQNAEFDSILVNSRSKADIVLKSFDTIKTPKLLYSLEDKYFYVIIKDTVYKEYYVDLNDLDKINKIYLIRTEINNRKQRKKHKEYQKLLSKAEPIFDVSKYSQKTISNMPNATVITGKPSYFVLTDSGAKYGEFSLSSITLPTPIDYNLLTYLMRRLSEEIAKNKQ